MRQLGVLTGRPKTSILHIHPVMNRSNDSGGNPEINTISSVQSAMFTKSNGPESISPKRQNTVLWHSDTVLEPVTANYTSLRLTHIPKTRGGVCLSARTT